MFEYTGYHNYISHNRTFNVVFSTTVALLISVFLGIILYNIGWINRDYGVPVILVLISIPSIIFIKELKKYEGVIAYHYLWKDIYRGIIDRKIINEDYAKKHGIINWKEYLADNKPDGRWNYHVDTKYMEQLTNSRNNILSIISEEYAEIRSELNKELSDLDSELNNTNRKLQNAQTKLDEIKSELKNVHPSAQQYHLECEKKSQQAVVDSFHDQITELEKAIHVVEDQIRQYDIAFVAQKNRIIKDYKTRSDKYARIATKKIEKNGLKYEIGSLKSPDYWINNPTERSLA